MPSKKVGLDLDGCLANFNEAYAAKFIDRGYVMPTFKVEQPQTWDYPETLYGVPREVVSEVWQEIWADPYFWADLSPLVPKDVFHTLNNLQWEGHEIYYLTLRNGKNAHKQTVQWLQRQGVTNPQVILTPYGKAIIASYMNLDCVLDDSPDVLDDYIVSGGDDYKVYRLWRPYNAHIDDDRLITVHSVAEMLDEVFGKEEKVAA